MKKFFKHASFLLLAAIVTQTATAQNPPATVCFSDGFGYTWRFTNITITSATTYYAEGTVSAYPNSKATLWVDITNGASNASVEAHAINLNADGCSTASDSFIYKGTGSIVHNAGYTGSGTWVSYCFGGPLNSGDWSAAGPCGTGKIKLNTSAVTPATPGGKGNLKSTAPAVLPSIVCFSDGFGYVWKFTNISATSATTYYAEGTVSAYPNSKATLWVDATNGASNASVEVHAINLNADGCTTASDSFVYKGTANINHGVGYTGSGTWVSYCFGGPLNSGDWSAAGPCGGAGKVVLSTSATKPASPGNSVGKAAAKAPATVCFSDGFGYVWKFSSITMTSATTYYAEGWVSAYPNSKATLWVDLTNGASNASVEVHAINLNADGCTTASDSFVYKGTANIDHGVGYTGSGTWVSYCFGGPLNSGDWSAAGPCGGASKVILNTTGPFPAKPGGNLDNSKTSLMAVPNPLKNSTQIRYNLETSAKVNITVYNYMHQPVKVLVNESKTAGSHTVQWNAVNSGGNRVNTGLYQVVMMVGTKMTSTTIQVL